VVGRAMGEALADKLVASESARSLKTYRAAIDAALAGFGLLSSGPRHPSMPPATSLISTLCSLTFVGRSVRRGFNHLRAN
jgi:hypothetical protein